MEEKILILRKLRSVQYNKQTCKKNKKLADGLSDLVNIAAGTALTPEPTPRAHSCLRFHSQGTHKFI